MKEPRNEQILDNMKISNQKYNGTSLQLIMYCYEKHIAPRTEILNYLQNKRKHISSLSSAKLVQNAFNYVITHKERNWFYSQLPKMTNQISFKDFNYIQQHWYFAFVNAKRLESPNEKYLDKLNNQNSAKLVLLAKKAHVLPRKSAIKLISVDILKIHACTKSKLDIEAMNYYKDNLKYLIKHVERKWVYSNIYKIKTPIEHKSIIKINKLMKTKFVSNK